MISYEFFLDGDHVQSILEADKSTLRVRIGERSYDLHRLGEHLYTTLVNGTRRQIAVVKHQDTYYIDVDSVLLEVREASDEAYAGGAGEHGGAKDKIYAPMPGKIVKILVQVGDAVETQQPLVIVEAMKMENQVNAQADGRVKAVHYSPGDQVDTESPIIELDLTD